MNPFTRFYNAHSRSIKILVSLSLGLIIIFAYILLITLFANPRSIGIDSLVHVPDHASSRTTFTPQVVVALLSMLLTGATIALVTRCVEESLWNHLTPSTAKARITAGESRSLALWSVSIVARIRYLLFGGDSWALRFCGLLLLANAAVNPVLISGISQTVVSNSETTFQPRAVNSDPWAGFLDDVNTWYSSGTTRDLRGESAFLTSLNALNAPAADVCGSPLCHASGRMAGYQATCESKWIPNTNNMGLLPDIGQGIATRRFCSSQLNSHGVCVDLERGNPETAASFTNLNTSSLDGDFTTIFGAYVANWSSITSDHRIYTVDCRVRYGWVNVTQTGSEPPQVVRSSFEVVGRDELVPNLNYLGRIYGGDLRGSSGWNFTGGEYGANGEQIVIYPIGYALLGWRDTVDGQTVARRIERAWDMNNIFAFGRSIDTIDLSTTIETKVNKYVYNKLVLFILLVPFLASIFGIWGRWYVLSDELMLGYDPVRIVRCGPLYGVPPTMDQEELDKLVVARYLQPGTPWEDSGEREHYQFIASEADFVGGLRSKHTRSG